VQQCLTSCTSEGKSFHVHLDGYNLIPFFSGQVKESPRKEFLYWSDDGDLFAIRYQNWKVTFIENRNEGFQIWQNDFTRLRVPMLYNLREDPFERGPTSSWYPDWQARRVFVIVPAQAFVAQWLQTFKDYPPRQRPASFNLEDVMKKLTPQQD